MLRFNRSLASAGITGCILVCTAAAQNPPTSDQAKAAFTSKSSISNVTLDGTFISTEGSSTQQGNAHLVVGSDGTYSIALSKSAGAAGEARTRTDSDVGCTWTDPSGNNHTVDSFNCQTPAWFLPELPLLLSSEATAEWTLATQTTNGLVPHLKFNYQVGEATGQSPPPVLAIEMELSSANLLPTKAKFFIHPDGQSYVNIPVEVTYQNYQQVGGVSIPYHVQKFVNGTLVLDITISSANVN